MNKEMRDLIGVLGADGFKLEEIVYNPDRGASAVAKFAKDDISYEDSEGNDVSDNAINVDVVYNVCLDHVHRRYDENGEMIYNYNESKARAYINALMHGRRSSGSSGFRSSRSKTRSKTRS